MPGANQPPPKHHLVWDGHSCPSPLTFSVDSVLPVVKALKSALIRVNPRRKVWTFATARYNCYTYTDMKSTRKLPKPVPAETIARLADQGRDVSRFFTNTGRMMAPIQRVNVDLAAGMLEELDRAAKELNISRQAVIKTLIRQALDQQYVARRSRRPAKRR